VPASITAREEQYIVEWHIYSMRWVDTAVPRPLIRRITLYKHNITEPGITILV
jgi:hypothetical protein